MPHLVQILLPLHDNTGMLYAETAFEHVIGELTRHFGGVTAYTRTPAQGRWREAGGVMADDMIAVEVLVEDLDERWWRKYRERLETDFRQQEVMIRAHQVCRL